jgi:DNA repair exonuclease SbcCD ATPase subunit
MIRLNYIEGRDIGRHRIISKEIKGNVLGLWGVSGAGKSTVLQLIEWLLNGAIEHPDPIAEFVRKSETEDVKKMTGKARFTVDGSPAEIDRSQSTSGTATRELRWEQQGDKWAVTKKSAADVNDLMSTLVGANQKAISSIVFIRQGAFGKLFSGLDSDRRDFFVRLLMLGHLEKIAGVIDTYRKQMMGSVQDLSALRDQSEAAYNQARTYFEEVEFEMSRLRSLKPELEAGAELLRAWDQVTSREADHKSQSVVLDSVLAEIGLTRVGMDGWIADTTGKLEKLREDLRTANGRVTSRNTYATSQANLNAEITQIQAWLEKSTKLDEVEGRLKTIETETAGKPDPRIRIRKLDEWERSYRMVESLTERLIGIPAIDEEGLQAKRKAAEEAQEKSGKSYSDWQRAKADLDDLVKLSEVAHAPTDGEACRLCGNDHPDPKFIATAVENTRSLVDRLAAESNQVEDARRTAAAALSAAQNEASTIAEQRRNLEADVAREKAYLVGAPDGSSIVAERDQLHAMIPAYDQAKTLYDHLSEEARVLRLATAGAYYDQNYLASKKSELDLATQMLGMLPPAAELDAAIRDLTDAGVSTRAQLDKVTRQKDVFSQSVDALKAQSDALASLVERVTKERPYLITSVQAIAPVVTSENVEKVLSGFRERQTEFDAKTGKMEAARRALVEADKNLQEIDVRIAEQQNRITIGKELENVRSAFLPSGITTEYLTHQFRRIAVAAQDHLAQMSADFMVIASEQRALSFDFLRLNEPGGAWLSQNRMSGGQQVKLAIAVLLAIHELIIPQVGILVLDEPSTHLDADSRIALAEVLREIGNRGNFQLIVCDHSPELKDAYTDIIELTDDAGATSEESPKKKRTSR